MYNESISQTDATPTGTPHPEEGVFTVLLPEKRVFRLSRKGRGGDPVGMLNAVLTNDVPPTGRVGQYALLLDAKGRIQTDITVVRDGEDLLVVTEAAGAETALAILGRYAPFSRVELLETDLSVLGVYGDAAQGLFGTALAEHESTDIEFGEMVALAVGVTVPLRGLEVIAAPDTLLKVVDHLRGPNTRSMSAEEYETSRIEAGIPLFGKDITPENFPAEANLEKRAVNFAKGCYPGQETVARTHYRGQPNKRLHRFIAAGDVEIGAAIVQNEKEVGHLTSVAPIAVDGKTYALGYLKRKADTNGEFTAGEATLKVSEPKGS